MALSILSLAAETRMQIYRYALTFSHSFYKLRDRYPKIGDLCYDKYADNYYNAPNAIEGTVTVPIFATNRQIHEEALPIFYAINTIIILPTAFCNTAKCTWRKVDRNLILARNIIVDCGTQARPERWLGCKRCKRRFLSFENRFNAFKHLRNLTFRADSAKMSPLQARREFVSAIGSGATITFTGLGRFRIVSTSNPEIIFEHATMARAYDAAMSPYQTVRHDYDGYDTPFNRIVYAVWPLQKIMNIQLREDASMQPRELQRAWRFELDGFREAHPECEDSEVSSLEMLTYLVWKYGVLGEHSRLFVLDF